jgi:hypothetical protein
MDRTNSVASTTISVVCAIGFLAPAPARAQVSDESVDRVLAALADVIKDRAKEVASETIKRRLAADLCAGNKIKVANQWLRIGGSEECRNGTARCKNDDVFGGACHLLRSYDSLPLTDVHFLKQLGADATNFAIRLAGIQLSEEDFGKEHFDKLGGYLFDVMQHMGRSHPDIEAIVDRTLEFADDFGEAALPAKTLARVRALPELAALRVQLQSLDVQAACDAKTPSCAKLAGLWATAAGSACATDDDQKAFAELFGSGEKFEGYRSLKCGGDDESRCQQAQLLVRLEPALRQLACPVEGEAALPVFRQLAYVALEKDIYVSAIDGLGGDRDVATQFFSALRRLTLPEVRREEVARGIRVVANAVYAYASDTDRTKEWFKQLTHDVNGIQWTSPISLDSLASLRRDNKDKWGGRVRVLRDSVKDFLALLLLDGYVAEVLGNRCVPGIEEPVRSLADVADALQRAGKAKPSAEQAVRLIADIVDSVGAMRQEIAARATEAKVRLPEERLPQGVLSRATALLREAHDRDWVALALEICDALTCRVQEPKIASEQSESSQASSKTCLTHSELPPAAKRSIHFVRVLMSMYQAKTTDEAKGIFQAELQDAAARRNRWGQFSVDVGALLGAGGGGIWGWATGATQADRQGAYGLFAPFGLQFAWPYVGVLLYPVDLGAYLVGRDDPKANTSRRWPDSLRAGATAFVRPWADVPIDFGVAADYHPPFESSPTELRVFGVLALELPLYAIH